MKWFVAGTRVELVSVDLSRAAADGGELPFELELGVGDVIGTFDPVFDAWCAHARGSSSDSDDLTRELGAHGWPSLPALLAVDRELFAVVLLALGDRLLRHLCDRRVRCSRRGRHAAWRSSAPRVRFVPTTVGEVELAGDAITLRGAAVALSAPAATIH